ncbi:EF-P lysine aminoacylase EpmA [Planctomycetes bacterium K23_9]|uniref:Elongation factor P--(R)-beta-lysine ligase n=1 Tax=Stieleria marina TaxID=1930275 RepID=A0A517P359_9BACT|nr:Elongation factor P--(R)-beta-lysine ligase [Planctomycetes bacterium K23_9]
MNSSFPPNLTCLKQRAELLRWLRAFFDDRGFLEVQTPCLSRDCVVDPYIDPLSVKLPGYSERFFLQTSPESMMKRMLAAGAPSIYSIGPVFRAEESGHFHNTEFTMLEWYDVGADLDAGICLLGDLVSSAIGATGFDRLTYREVFRQHLDIDPIEASTDDLCKRVAEFAPGLANDGRVDRDDCLDLLLSEKIQSKLGKERPLIMTDYPISQAALAKPSETDVDCAARFELFCQGVELANGYDELLDSDVLLQRSKQNNLKRVASGRHALPDSTRLAEAIRNTLPACVGVALGVDRLLMIITGANGIDQVMPFTTSIA